MTKAKMVQHRFCLFGSLRLSHYIVEAGLKVAV